MKNAYWTHRLCHLYIEMIWGNTEKRGTFFKIDLKEDSMAFDCLDSTYNYTLKSKIDWSRRFEGFLIVWAFISKQRSKMRGLV